MLGFPALTSQARGGRAGCLGRQISLRRHCHWDCSPRTAPCDADEAL